MASTSRLRLRLPCPEVAEPERPPPALTSDILEEIFLRVASAADLARASTACVSFRRIIADHSFLRRYRSIHPPLFLGFISSSGFHPVEAPHPSAAVARSVARAADFSFDDLPRRDNGWPDWRVCDVRSGGILVGCRSENGPIYLDLMVYDPMSWRCRLLPPVSDELLASVKLLDQDMIHPMASFIPSRGPSGGIDEDASFSVIFWLQSHTRLGVFVFSSVSGCWSICMSTNFDSLGLDKFLIPGQCAYDCFYWKLLRVSTLMKLDMNTMQFCTVDLPPGHNNRRVVIVESGTNGVAMFSRSYGDKSVDYYIFSQNGSENSHGWHMMCTIPLPADYYISSCFRGPAEGYIFIEAFTLEQDEEHSEVFSLDIKSFKIERVSIASFASGGHPYFGFPPSMSPIRTQGYGED